MKKNLDVLIKRLLITIFIPVLAIDMKVDASISKPDITVQVIAEGDADIKNEQFEYTITKEDQVVVGMYQIDQNEKQKIPENGKVELKKDQLLSFYDLEEGTYTITQTTPTHSDYKETTYSVNSEAVEKGMSTTVSVSKEEESKNGGWLVDEDNQPKPDEDGYYVYTITDDMFSDEGSVLFDGNPLAQLIINEISYIGNMGQKGDYPIKIINNTKYPLSYVDYEFSTINQITIGENFDGLYDRMENRYGYGFGSVWQTMLPILEETTNESSTLNAIGFDGKIVRSVSAPLRSSNPAVISFLHEKTGRNYISAAAVSLLDMENLSKTYLAEGGTFEGYDGSSVTLSGNTANTYADLLRTYYKISDLNQLTPEQKYNVFGTGKNGSTSSSAIDGQSQFTNYNGDISGRPELWCLSVADIMDPQKLNEFKTWGFSMDEIVEGDHLKMGGGVLDPSTYAYQGDYYLLEKDPAIISLGYEYLYDRGIRFTFNDTLRPITGSSDGRKLIGDIGGLKSYYDKDGIATENVEAAFKAGVSIQPNDTLVLDDVKASMNVPNSWNLFREFDFGFNISFQADTSSDVTVSIVFTNTYEKKEDSIDPSDPTDPVDPTDPTDPIDPVEPSKPPKGNDDKDPAAPPTTHGTDVEEKVEKKEKVPTMDQSNKNVILTMLGASGVIIFIIYIIKKSKH